MAAPDTQKPDPVVALESTDSKDEQGLADEVTPAKVLKQVEFYFADSNLPFDRFMWTLHTANSEHWVPIATIASFKRMRQYQAKGIPWIAEALRTSESLLEVDETGTKVRRREEVAEPKGQYERSVYAKGFGEETPTLQDELDQFFSKYGKVNAVRMRRIDVTKKFKGSVFCEYETLADATKFLNADPKPQWNGVDLLIMSKDAYCEMKIKEKGLTGAAANLRKSTLAGRNFNAFQLDEKDKRTKGKNKQEEAEPKEKPEVYLEFMGKRLKVNQEDGGSVEEAEVPFTKGATLKFTGCGGELRWVEVKAPLKEKFERPPFIKYTRGEDSGLVGFDKALTEDDIAFVREKLKTINNNDIVWELPDDEDEKAFQIERAQAAAQRIISGLAGDAFEGGGGGGSAGRGGRGRGRGARGGRGRGGGRGNRGGRGGGAARRGAAGKAGASGGGGDVEMKNGGDGGGGEKRKQPASVEPDGGPDTKGQSIPVVHASKKPRREQQQQASKEAA